MPPLPSDSGIPVLMREPPAVVSYRSWLSRSLAMMTRSPQCFRYHSEAIRRRAVTASSCALFAP